MMEFDNEAWKKYGESIDTVTPALPAILLTVLALLFILKRR